ncbi:MAG TPA: GNAT family N-acetyltransferase [Vicinamibacterales bacterium]|nr:GNAT family N-acetyltransferase [Vicinamibacterales bacterium]
MTLVDAPVAGSVPDAFLMLPALVYRDDPRWIPEDPDDVRAAFGRSNPMLARVRGHLFCVPGESRAAAFFDPAIEIDGAPAAFMGYFESRGSAAADATVVAAVGQWARAQGARAVFGPVNFSTAGNYRVLLSAEPDALPFAGEPYNPPEYAARLEAAGFRLRQRYLSQIVGRADFQANIDRRAAATRRCLTRGKYRVIAWEPAQWAAAAERLFPVVDCTFRENLGYAPMPFPAFAALLASSVLPRFCPETSVVALDPAGEIAGFALAYPHYGPLVVQGAGARRVPMRAVRFDTHAAALREHPPVGWILKTVGVAPAHRNRGLAEALVMTTTRAIAERADYMIAALIREDNVSRRILVAVGAERWYALYGMSLE